MPFKGYCYLILCCLLHFSFFVNAQDNGSIENTSVERSLTGFENIDEKLSLWEFGVGGATADVANYPASSQRNAITAAAPYLIYRGDIFRVGGGNGVRAVVIDKKDLEIGVSFGGAFSADSEDGTVREGMPELDYLLEVGPQAVYRMKDFTFKKGGNAILNARLQLRAAFSTDFSTINNRGFVLNPVITYQQRGRVFKGTALSASIGMVFATERFHDYYYEVSNEFVNNQRSAYNAKAGYLGTRISTSLAFPITDSIRGFIGAGAQLYNGAANEDSPLFEKDVTYSIALGFVWRLYKSNRKANW